MPSKRQSLKSRAEPHKKRSGRPESLPLLNCLSISPKLIRCSRLVYHTSSILSIIFSLLPIDVRQYGTRAAISTWHSWSTYRNRAIFRSYLPSGARFITAFICSALSPCNAGGKTMRAAAIGSTEPEGLRQLSGVAHHIAKHGKTVTKRHHFVGVAEMVCFREVTKTSVCSACHDILLTAFAGLPLPGQRKTE